MLMEDTKTKIPLSEDIDFHFLLSVMQYLEEDEQFTWLPELFSIIGTDRLVTLCKYAGGESIKIPTLSQLFEDIEAIQAFYDVDIKKSRKYDEIPYNLQPKLKVMREQIAKSDKSKSTEKPIRQ